MGIGIDFMDFFSFPKYQLIWESVWNPWGKTLSPMQIIKYRNLAGHFEVRVSNLEITHEIPGASSDFAMELFKLATPFLHFKNVIPEHVKFKW